MKSKNKGAVSVIFSMFLPIMLLLCGFTVYVSQMLLTHIRTVEAVEVSALALIADVRDSDQENVKYVENLINRYVKDSFQVDVNVDVAECDLSGSCSSGSPFVIGLKVSATTWHNSWLSFLPVTEEGGIFEPNFGVSGSIETERNLSRPLDVYFVSDFSGSMELSWGNGMDKVGMLKYTIKRVLEYLEEHQDSNFPARVSFIPFNQFVSYKQADGSLYELSHDYYLPRREENYPATMAMMWHHPQTWENIPLIPGYPIRRVFGRTPNKKRYVIEPTLDYNAFYSQLSTFAASDGTESVNGMISAAQIADKATDIASETNPEQLFILLSDGIDSFQPYQFVEMEELGFCNSIRQRIGSKENKFSQAADVPTTVSMAIIGINFESDNDGHKSCFGDHIYNAEYGSDDLYKIIIGLINENTGRFKGR